MEEEERERERKCFKHFLRNGRKEEEGLYIVSLIPIPDPIHLEMLLVFSIEGDHKSRCNSYQL